MRKCCGTPKPSPRRRAGRRRSCDMASVRLSVLPGPPTYPSRTEVPSPSLPTLMGGVEGEGPGEPKEEQGASLC